ncbi:MAG: hypothetical protein RPS47_13880 [Colwellia sp.]|jgi:hypothetical protein
MKYILTILILISSVSANSNSAYLYNPDGINLFYKACDCSNNNIEFCTNLIEKVSANNNNFNDMKSIKILHSTTRVQFQNDIRFHNRNHEFDLSCFYFTNDEYQHNASIVEALKEFDGWRE